MFLLLFIFAFSAENPHRIQAMISSDQAKTSGGAFIIHSFNMDQSEFSLQSSNANVVDALLWYPSGKVYARYKRGNTKFLGQGNPVSDSQTLNFYIPQEHQLKIKEDIKLETSKQASLQARDVIHKAILTDAEGVDIFFESTQTQVLQDNHWVTP